MSIAPRAIQYVTGTVPNYSYNVNGICGATASAMWLKWYDNYVNNSYVPSSLTSSIGVALIQHLVSYIPSNSNAGQVSSGIYSYLGTQGISHFPYTDYANETTILSAVNGMGRPYILRIAGHPQYTNHWVTGYGYSQPSPGTIFAIVNDGWGSTGIQITMSYAANIVY